MRPASISHLHLNRNGGLLGESVEIAQSCIAKILGMVTLELDSVVSLLDVVKWK